MNKWIVLMLLLCLTATPAFAGEAEWIFPLPANVVDGRGGFLQIVNRDNLLDGAYVPHNLTRLQLRGVDGPHELRREAAEALTRFFEAAEVEGMQLYVKSSYRSYQTQSTMYQNRLERYGRDDGVVAYPGSSDHQTGLGVDILNYDWTKKEGMTSAFGETREARWMEQNAAAYGFILRYLPDRQDITGIIYEPWHYRYVGETVAEYIMNERLTLEEFSASVHAAVAAYEAKGGDFAALVRELNALPVPVHLAGDEEGEGEVSLFYPKNP